MRNWKVILKWLIAILVVTIAFFTLRIYIKHVVEVKTFRTYQESTEKTEFALKEGVKRIKIQTGNVWNNKSNIKDISLPTCIIHSTSDEITPHSMSLEIAENNPSAKLLLLENYLHNGLFKKPSSTLWTQILDCN